MMTQIGPAIFTTAKKRHTFDLISHGKRARSKEFTSIIKRPADTRSRMHLPLLFTFRSIFKYIDLK